LTLSVGKANSCPMKICTNLVRDAQPLAKVGRFFSVKN
jgi:hypothetical protein